MADQTRTSPSALPFVTAATPQQVLLVYISEQYPSTTTPGREMDRIHEQHDHHVVSVDELWSSQQLDENWLLSLKQRVHGASRRSRHAETKQPPTIFRVPRNIRETDPEAYEPRMVSIGPYHRGKPQLQETEERKWNYLWDFLSRNPDRSLDECLKRLKSVEHRARGSYSDELDMKSNEFLEMLLLDGCFVVELFLKRRDGLERWKNDDPITATDWALSLVMVDMIMLENQLPFFVLQLLYDTVLVAKPLTHLAFSCLNLDERFLMNRKVLSEGSEFHHLLHLFHSSVLHAAAAEDCSEEGIHSSVAPKDCVEQRIHTSYPKITYTKSLLSKLRRFSSLSPSFGKLRFGLRRRRRGPREPGEDSIVCATNLREAGIKFKRKTKAASFLDVTFRNGRIEMPQMGVFDLTKYLLRNMIAFEQCFPSAGDQVTTYAALMDCIIDTPGDVALLHRSGVIINGLGDDDAAARLFNKLCSEVSVGFEDTYLADLVNAVNKHCGSKINRWRAKLNHVYFNNPWSIISLCGAVVLLFFTLVQTIFTVLAYIHPVN